MRKTVLFLLQLMIIALIFFSCTTGSILKEYGTSINQDIPAISEIYENDFLIGSAVEPYQLTGPEGALLAYHFNSLTAENVMKFRTIHPEMDRYDFSGADKLVAFAKDNKMMMRGHTFVWHHPNEIAPWVFEDEQGNPRSREEVLNILEDHIKVLMDRYGKDVYCWDVVNEAIDTSEPDNRRRTPWFESIGPDYVEQAFRIAHKINPKAKLFLNEYDTFEPQKRDALIELIKELQAADVPIDGVGLQMHISLTHPEIEAIEETIDLFRELDLEIHITELDMSLYTREFEILDEAPEEYLIRQAHRYRELFEIYQKNSDIIGNVTFWGLNDSHTWLSTEEASDWPLVFDRNYEPKLAYYGVIQDTGKLPEDVIINIIKQDFVYQAHQGTPIIDGEIDEIWDKAEIVKTETQVMQEPGSIAEVRALWDEEHIYVLAEVKDRTLSNNAAQAYMNDSFEVFVDQLKDRSTALGADDYQFRVGYTGRVEMGGFATKSLIDAKALVTEDGYLVELAIALNKVTGAEGVEIGLDFQVNDNFGNAAREGISKWNDPTNESWRNTTGWGTLEMIP